MKRIIITYALVSSSVMSSLSEINGTEKFVEMLESERNQPEFVAFLEKGLDLDLTDDIKLELHESEFGEQLSIIEKANGDIVFEHILGEGADQVIFSNSRLVEEVSIVNLKGENEGKTQLSFTAKKHTHAYRFSIVRIKKFRYKITREKKP